MPLPASYETTTIVDDSGRERALIFAYDEVGNPVASILFKGRDELPEYSVLRGGPTTHLGEAPRFVADGSDGSIAHAAWVPDGTGTGIPHFVVDCSPLGVAQLAARLGDAPEWQTVAGEMAQGVWSSRALSIADALAATMCVDPDGLPTIERVRTAETALMDGHLGRMALGIDAVLQGAVTPELEALTGEHGDFVQFVANQASFAEYTLQSTSPEVIAHWRGRLQAVAAEGGVELFIEELRAARGSEQALGFDVERCVEQVIARTHSILVGRRWDPALDPRQWFTMGAQPEQALLVARALCGDAAAAADVKQALAVMAAHDQYLGEQLAIRNRSETLMRNDPASIDPERLVLVHATSFEPQRGTDGSVELHTRFDTTGYARASLHFTLNHRVVSHMYGQWDGSGYVVVAPYAGAQGRNGDPANLLGVDTWWQCNPGEAVALPGAIVVRLDPNAHDLMTRVGRDVVVKSSNFTEADIATLQTAGVLDLDAVEATIQDQLEYKAIEAADVAGVREALIAGAARDLAVDTSIVELGGSITFGGDWACGLEPEITALAHERGLAHSAHCNAPSYDAESLNASFFGHEPRTGHSGGLLHSDAATRRVAIAAGVVAPATPQRVVARDGFDSLAW